VAQPASVIPLRSAWFPRNDICARSVTDMATKNKHPLTPKLKLLRKVARAIIKHAVFEAFILVFVIVRRRQRCGR